MPSRRTAVPLLRQQLRWTTSEFGYFQYFAYASSIVHYTHISYMAIVVDQVPCWMHSWRAAHAIATYITYLLRHTYSKQNQKLESNISSRRVYFDGLCYTFSVIYLSIELFHKWNGQRKRQTKRTRKGEREKGNKQRMKKRRYLKLGQFVINFQNARTKLTHAHRHIYTQRDMRVSHTLNWIYRNVSIKWWWLNFSSSFFLFHMTDSWL